MVETLTFLTSITFLLVAAIICVALSRKLKLPLPLLLFIGGLILGNIFYFDKPVIQLGGEFLAGFSIIALIVVLFDAASKIKFYNMDKSVQDSFKFFVVALIFNLMVLTFASKTLFDLSYFAAIVLSLLVSCIEFSVIFSRKYVPMNKLTEFLNDESQISCASILLIPFLIIYFMQILSPGLTGTVYSKLFSLIVSIFGGVGAGLLIALILFKLMNKVSIEGSSSFILAVGLLLAYVLAQRIEGNGLIAVATMGVIFGNVFLRNKNAIKKHENIVYSIVELFIFVLIGAVVGLPSELPFYKISLGLFILYLAVRFLAAQMTLRNYDFTERLEISLFVPKGVATVVLAFALLNYSFTGVVLMTQILLAFFVYSLVLDTVLDKVGFYRHR